MNNVIRYFVWNAMLVGTLMLSTVFKFDLMISILAWFYGIEAAIYFITIMIPEKDKHELYDKIKGDIKAYKIAFEPVYIAVAFYLHHNYIGICMFVTFCGYVHMYLSAKKYLADKQ